MIPRTRLGQTILAVGTVLGLAASASAQQQLAANQLLARRSAGAVANSFFGLSIGSGARALGMGGAFIAIADDGTASSWNPAGLCVLEAPEASLVGQPYGTFAVDISAASFGARLPIPLPDRDFAIIQRFHPYTVSQRGSSIDFASFAYPVRFGRVKLVPQISFQRAIDLGLDERVDAGGFSATRNAFVGAGVNRRDATESTESRFSGNVQASGGIDVHSASAGLTFTPRLYAGLALNWWRNGGRTQRVVTEQARIDFVQVGRAGASPFLSFTEDIVTATAQEADYRGFNVSGGLMLLPTRWSRVGLVYKSGFTMKRTLMTLEDELLFRSNEPASDTGRVVTIRQETTRIDEQGRIRWPRTVGVGVALVPNDRLTVSADVTVSDWSDTIIETSTISESQIFGRPPSGPGGPTTATRSWPTNGRPDRPEAIENKYQLDTRQIRMGAEYIFKPSLLKLTALPLRVGTFTDRQLNKQVGLRPVHHLGLAAGVGLVWRRVTLDLAYIRRTSHYRRQDFFTVIPDANREGRLLFRDHRAEQQDHFHSQQVYVSTIVRF